MINKALIASQVAGVVILTVAMTCFGLWVFDMWWTDHPVRAAFFITSFGLK